MIKRERRDDREARGDEKKEIYKGSRERIEKERKEKESKRELRRQFEEEEKEHHHLPMLVVQLPQGTAVLLRWRIIRKIW